jgi:hypothetical protein
MFKVGFVCLIIKVNTKTIILENFENLRQQQNRGSCNQWTLAWSYLAVASLEFRLQWTWGKAIHGTLAASQQALWECHTAAKCNANISTNCQHILRMQGSRAGAQHSAAKARWSYPGKKRPKTTWPPGLIPKEPTGTAAFHCRKAHKNTPDNITMQCSVNLHGSDMEHSFTVILIALTKLKDNNTTFQPHIHYLEHNTSV